MAQISASQWKLTIEAQKDASLLQTAEWGSVKTAFGWSPAYVMNEAGGAMILFRNLPRVALGATMAYIPRGPVIFHNEPQKINDLWEEIHRLCRARHAFFLRVEPDFWQNTAEAEFLRNSMQGFENAFSTVQPPRTIVVPLTGSEEDRLARMNQKTRYNIRLAQKKDLVIREENDVSAFMELMAKTGERDHFHVHSAEYYQHCYNVFKESGKAWNLVAYYHDKPLGVLMLFIHGNRGYYLYGASSDEERNRMPNHLLQWTAMNICAANGCTEYDLWGVPDEEPETLEAQFQERSDGLWSVYRFKRGFGGEIKRTMGSFDFPYHPLFYRLSATFYRRKKAQQGSGGPQN